jgi:hypothetical protein
MHTEDLKAPTRKTLDDHLRPTIAFAIRTVNTAQIAVSKRCLGIIAEKTLSFQFIWNYYRSWPSLQFRTFAREYRHEQICHFMLTFSSSRKRMHYLEAALRSRTS